MKRFENKVVVVTGGASGIGEATTERFLNEGARVIVADYNLERMQQLEERLRLNQSDCKFFQTDVSDVSSVNKLRDFVLDNFGVIDVVVSNAGVWSAAPFLDLDLSEWDRIMNINLRGSFIVGQTFTRTMVNQGVKGSVVFTASTNSFLAEPYTAHYNASKGALVMLVKTMAVDLAEYNIRVNAIAPGTIRTPLTEKLLSDDSGLDFAFPPARRWGEPEECAGTIAFLASNDASYITGEVIVVDGGQISLNGVVTK